MATTMCSRRIRSTSGSRRRSCPRSGTARIYARGAGDNKGQHFANLLAIESLLAVNGALPCNVIVLLEGEEEVGSPNIAEFVRDHPDLLDVDLVVTSDGPVHDSGRQTIEFGVRGVADFELRARGANRDLHSGNFGGVAPNPIWTLVHALATMKNPAGEITIDGFYDSIVAADRPGMGRDRRHARRHGAGDGRPWPDPPRRTARRGPSTTG